MAEFVVALVSGYCSFASAVFCSQMSILLSRLPISTLLSTRAHACSQVGLPNQAVFVQASAHGGLNRLTFSLSREEAAQILEEKPHVKQAYLAQVRVSHIHATKEGRREAHLHSRCGSLCTANTNNSCVY